MSQLKFAVLEAFPRILMWFLMEISLMPAELDTEVSRIKP